MLRIPLGLDIAEDVDARLRRIPPAAASTGADIVCFQENWDPTIRAVLTREMARRGYRYEATACDAPADGRTIAAGAMVASFGPVLAAPHARRDFLKQAALLATTVGLNAAGAGALVFDRFRRSMGNGLQIFSRYPLSRRRAMRFSVTTRADEATVAKGALAVDVSLPVGKIGVATTHLGAVSFDSINDREDPPEAAARLRQLREMLGWLNGVEILAGDFNFHYRRYANKRYTKEFREEYRLVTERFVDSYRALHGCDNPRELTDSMDNPYKRSGHFSSSPDCVIDYIFTERDSRWCPVASEVVFRDPISDHYGVVSTFQTSYQ